MASEAAYYIELQDKECIAILTREATRAARGLLGWSLEDLAKASGVAFGTLSRFENGRPVRAATAAKIIAAFDAGGVDLITGDDRTGAVLVYARRAAADETGERNNEP